MTDQITIIVRYTNEKLSILKVDDVNKYVQENGLIEIDSINNMPTFKAADYHEIPCEAE